MRLLIEQIIKRVESVAVQLNKLSEDEWQKKSTPDKWSKKEILGHLVDSAQTNIRRMVVGQYQDQAHIIYHQNEWVKAANYQEYNTKELILLWELLNKHFARILDNLPKQYYGTFTNWSSSTTPLLVGDLVTLEFAAHDYFKHLNNHLMQMEVHLP
jgi:hypothetical protein